MGHRTCLISATAITLALCAWLPLSTLGAQMPSHGNLPQPATLQSAGASGATFEVLAYPGLFFAVKNQTSVFFLKLVNTGDAPLEISRIGTATCNSTTPGPSWLSLQTTGPLTVPVNDTLGFWFSIFGEPALAGSDIASCGQIYFVSNAAPPSDSLTCTINMLVGYGVGKVADTLITPSIRLAVRNTGDMGGWYAGNVNMNFSPPAECDTGSNSRGNAAVYLGDASPVIVQHISGNAYPMSNSMETGTPFVPVSDGPAGYDSLTANYQKYYGGEALSSDGLLRVSNTWWAPTQPDSNNFIIHEFQVWPATPGASVPNITVGEAIDWDIPTDSGQANNIGGYEQGRGVIWLRGLNSLDAVTDCQDNSYRYGGSALIGMRMESQSSDTLTRLPLYGGFALSMDSILPGPGTEFPGQKWWPQMNRGTYVIDPHMTDQLGMLVFKGGTSGYLLPANDTLTVYTAIISVRTAASTTAGLDSLIKAVDQAQRWVGRYVTPIPNLCCKGKRGDMNRDGVVDSQDLSWIICMLTVTDCRIPCSEAANVNGSGIADLADLASLVSYLTGGGFQLVNCPLR
jgi:hypothetical protein